MTNKLQVNQSNDRVFIRHFKHTHCPLSFDYCQPYSNNSFGMQYQHEATLSKGVGYIKMSNSDSLNNISTIISKIMDEQLKDSDTNSSNFQKLAEEQNIDDIFITAILPIYEVLKTLREKNQIDIDEFNTRIDSLQNIIKLLQELVEEK